MASREEQETTVTFNRAEETIHIWTAYPPHVRKLRKDDRATEIDGSDPEQTEDIWAEFKISWDDFDPITGLRKRLSDSTRQAMAERARQRFGIVPES